MKTTAVRLYGASDLRMEQFELPQITDEELLVHVVSDSVCMSTYKAVKLGAEHKRVPDDVAENPIVVGHEMCCEIVEVGTKLKNEWKPGDKMVIQPALNMPDNDYSVGYSFPNIGGNMTYGVVPKEVIERDCALHYKGKTFFEGSLAEPLSCILRAFKSNYHTNTQTFERTDGTKEGGKIILLGGAGPMGIGALDIALHYAKPSMVVVTDMDEKRLAYAEKIFKPEDQKARGIDLRYINVKNVENQAEYLKEISGGGFDDIFVMVPSEQVIEVGNEILAVDGCLNFFSGPTDHNLSGRINFYRLHYDFTHLIGTSGGVPQDMVEIIQLIEEGVLHPAAMITHIGGLDSVIDTIMGMSKVSGLKKICYPNLTMPMTQISELKDNQDELSIALSKIIEKHGGLWSEEAEQLLLKAISGDSGEKA